MTRIKTSLSVSTLIIIFSLLLPNFWILSAQEINVEFAKRVESFQNQNPREFVYIHTDREVYAAGEQISFKAYLRNLYNPTAISTSKNLHIIIIDPGGNLQQEKIFKLIDNQSDGVFKLIISLGEGEHNLIAWTDGMETGPAQNVFRKKIFITERLFPRVIINLSAGQSRYLPGDIAQIKIDLLSISGKVLKRKKISYIASLNGVSFEAKEVRTDKEGKASIDLPIPESTDPGLVVVEVAVEQLGEISTNSILVPTSKTPVWIDFAPEGGILLDGFESLIGFRSYDFLGNPVEVEGEVLTMNNEHLKDFKSSGLGFGSFSIRANSAKILKVRLTKPSGVDIDFTLPVIQQRGIQLSLTSKNNDKLDFVVNSDIEDVAIPLHAVAEMNGILKYEKRFNLKLNSEFSIPISSINSSGELKVNILSRTGQVLAHRSVYLTRQSPSALHSVESNNLKVKPSIMELKIKNGNGTPGQASFSISSTDQILTPEWKPVQDIISWFNLGPDASYAAFPKSFLVNPSKEDEETIDHFMLFQINNHIDWEAIKSDKTSGSEKTITEFRDELKQLYQTGDFESLIAQIRLSQFFNRYYIDANPGFMGFIRSNKPALEKLGYFPSKLTTDEQVQQQLANGQSIMSVLMSIKPYKIVDGKIVFRGNDSFNYQGGVLIVIDGVPRGTDPAVLSSVSPYDVESLKASASISDIQKYSGLNSTGIIELTTKKGSNRKDQLAGSSIFPTILWNPNQLSNTQGIISVVIPESPLKSTVKTTIQGVDGNGNLLIWNK